MGKVRKKNSSTIMDFTKKRSLNWWILHKKLADSAILAIKHGSHVPVGMLGMDGWILAVLVHRLYWKEFECLLRLSGTLSMVY